VNQPCRRGVCQWSMERPGVGFLCFTAEVDWSKPNVEGVGPGERLPAEFRIDFRVLRWNGY